MHPWKITPSAVAAFQERVPWASRDPRGARAELTEQLGIVWGRYQRNPDAKVDQTRRGSQVYRGPLPLRMRIEVLNGAVVDILEIVPDRARLNQRRKRGRERQRERSAGGAQPASSKLVCTPAGACDAHRNGDAAPKERCPWYCDRDGCDQEATIEVDGATYCRWHAARVLAAT